MSDGGLGVWSESREGSSHGLNDTVSTLRAGELYAHCRDDKSQPRIEKDPQGLLQKLTVWDSDKGYLDVKGSVKR